MIIAITGITGNMGQAVLEALQSAEHIERIKLLCHNKKRMKKLLKKYKTLRDKTEVVEGGMTKNALSRLIEGAELVINMAAVIPPRSDHDPRAAEACNERGVIDLIEAIESANPAPALVHVSTVAVYGNRSGAHPFGRVGDPLIATPLDAYSTTKIRAEFAIMESRIEKWAVLRQSAMLHPRMLKDNMHDGLMFHTTFDAPLEWCTAHDSGLLMRNVAEAVATDSVPDGFWKHCFNMTSGKANRKYGIQTFDDGFAVMNGSAVDFFKPWYNATRNFHGMWFLDGDALNDMFDYQRQTTDMYWSEVFKAHPVYKLGKFVPKCLIRLFVFKRLLRNTNAPTYWVRKNDEARITAFFGGRENFRKLKASKWSDIALPDYSAAQTLPDNATPVFYGFDFDKPDDALTQADLEAVAEAHGGVLLGTFRGDMYEKLDWQTQDGEVFSACAYTVLRAGHWFNPAYKSFVWDFDRLCKKDKVFASVWYDSHGKDEDNVYGFDENCRAYAKKIAYGAQK